jgi:[ribosomal protein S5]-alanine N-acetyltransferase
MQLMKFDLRPWAVEDLTSLVKYANNPRIACFLTNQFPHPYNEQDGKIFIERAINSDPLNIFAIDVMGEAVGAIGVFPQTDIYCKNAEMGYWLAEPFWKNGIITKAIHRIVMYAFDTFDIDRIFARPFASNRGSCRVLEKNKFVMEARFEKVIFKNDRYHDEVVYALRRDTFNSLI